MSAKGRIDIRNVADISKEKKIRIEIERDGTLYRFDPFRTKVEKEKVEEEIEVIL